MGRVGHRAGDGGICWDRVSHAYGPAVDAPAWIAGLRDRGAASQCLDELYGSITHQGSRYDATPVCVPLLVDAALDRSVVDRAGVIFLIDFCAMGYTGDWLDWRNQRRIQTGPYERASWDAVVAEHGRLRELLADGDRSVAAAALTALAWTGDRSDRVLAAIAEAAESGDGRDQCTAWLSSVVLGQLPPGLAAPVTLAAPTGPGRFGAAIAALEFGNAAAPPEAVDELCSVFASADAGSDLTACEFLKPEDPERIAACALGDVPAHLRAHTSTRLLAAIAGGSVLGAAPLRAYLRLNLGQYRPPATTAFLPAPVRQALTSLLQPLSNWRGTGTIGGRIYELEERGLPATLDQLTQWLTPAED
jgi:hypothetical protein